MVSHLVAFYQSTYNISDVEINVVKDDVLSRTAATRILVPPDLNRIGWGYAAATDLAKARYFTPSLETRRFYALIHPHRKGGVLPTIDVPRIFVPEPPVELTPNEELSAKFTVGGSAAEDIYGLASFQVAALPAVPAGEFKIVRCTGSTTLVKGDWTSVKLTPDVSLEAGEYALVKFIAISTNVIAARVIIPGQVWRPGLPGFPGAEADALAHATVYSKLLPAYEMGRFDHLHLPEFQFLANAADTSEVVYLYLVKVA
jgi:hypothetical protein